jgi:hypothetical protein
MAINMFEGARRTLIIVGFGLLVTAGCSGQATPEDSVFTLYQNSPSDVGARVGVATFDMKVSDPRFNYVECQEAAALYQADWIAKTRDKPDLPAAKNFKYWCEKGRYKP